MNADDVDQRGRSRCIGNLDVCGHRASLSTSRLDSAGETLRVGPVVSTSRRLIPFDEAVPVEIDFGLSLDVHGDVHPSGTLEGIARDNRVPAHATTIVAQLVELDRRDVAVAERACHLLRDHAACRRTAVQIGFVENPDVGVDFTHRANQSLEALAARHIPLGHEKPGPVSLRGIERRKGPAFHIARRWEEGPVGMLPTRRDRTERRQRNITAGLEAGNRRRQGTIEKLERPGGATDRLLIGEEVRSDL